MLSTLPILPSPLNQTVKCTHEAACRSKQIRSFDCPQVNIPIKLVCNVVHFPVVIVRGSAINVDHSLRKRTIHYHDERYLQHTLRHVPVHSRHVSLVFRAERRRVVLQYSNPAKTPSHWGICCARTARLGGCQASSDYIYPTVLPSVSSLRPRLDLP